MRTVVVYPSGTRADAVVPLDRIAQQREPYHVDGYLHVHVVDDRDERPVFPAWEPDEIEAFTRVVGHRPVWCVMAHLSWTDEAVESAAARHRTTSRRRRGPRRLLARPVDSRGHRRRRERASVPAAGLGPPQSGSR